jgi:hypothetical protein
MIFFISPCTVLILSECHDISNLCLASSLCCLALAASLYLFSIVTTNDAPVLGTALFGPGLTLLPGSSFSGGTDSAGVFTDGPFGIGNGVILTNGRADGALPDGDQSTDNGAPGSEYCGDDSYNAAVLQLNFDIEDDLDGFNIEFIIASSDV